MLDLARYIKTLQFGDVPDYDYFIIELMRQEEMCRQDEDSEAQASDSENPG